MKVLLLGATGNLGSRLIPSLLSHNHNVVAFVRSSSRLESLLPRSVYERVTVIEGDATNSWSVKRAILDNQCDAVVNTAGVAAMAPWKSSELPSIIRSVVDGVRAAGRERGSPLRAWFLGGLGVLYYPGTESMLSNYVPIFLEHRQNIALLRSLTPNSVKWSVLCPATLTPDSLNLDVQTDPQRNRLVASGSTPPLWRHSWIGYIPFIGRVVEAAMNASRYDTTLEQVAEFIASDLDSDESPWIGMLVGVIDGSK